jgi:flagellar biosynthesis/type III secretory pathway chaperone
MKLIVALDDLTIRKIKINLKNGDILSSNLRKINVVLSILSILLLSGYVT